MPEILELEVADDHAEKCVEVVVHEQIDALEATLSQCEQIDHHITHRFTPGMYIRQIIMPAGSIYTSKIHKTEHPFTMLKGLCSVKSVDGKWRHMKAPWFGVTKPGTRRVLVIHEETVWLTYHPTHETDLEKIEAELIEPHDFRKSLKKGKKWLGLP